VPADTLASNQKGAKGGVGAGPERQSKQPPSAMTLPTSPPSWSPGGPEVVDQPGRDDEDQHLSEVAAPGLPTVAGPRVPFRNLLGVTEAAPVTSAGPADQPGIPVTPATITLRFDVGPVSVTLETAKGDLWQVAEAARGKMLRRPGAYFAPNYYPWLGSDYSRHGLRYSFEPTSPAQVAGYPGLARVITVHTRNRMSQYGVQMYTVVGPYAVTLTAPHGQAAHDLGRLRLYPAAPPVTTPVVRMPSVSADAVEEHLTMVRGNLRLTAAVAPGHVSISGQDFALAILADLRSRIPDLAAGDWEPDVFLGGQPCVRDTFVRGGLSGATAVRSEFWWAGVADGRGVEVFVTGRNSIIGLDDATPLRDVLVALPPD
jgi:hypothetical protein